MQQPGAQDHKPTIEMSLREHLLAAGAGQPSVQPLPQHPHTAGPPHAIDPAIAGSAYQMSAGDPNDGNTSEGRSKGRRELSTSKRAAQNRAAQRAFRQRKEEYIKQLKDQVKEFEQLCELYKTLQTENYQLRDYIINLQSRLLETQGEIPPAPAGVDLNRPHGEPASLSQDQQQQSQHQQQQEQSQPQQSSPNSNNGGLSERQIGELQMAAQAAAAAQHGSSGNKHPNSEGSYDYAEKRQKVDGSPQGSRSDPRLTTIVGSGSTTDYDAFVNELQEIKQTA
ncbi:Nn.00g087670.m01.CDS01 [Neocucurbitaria sp. VM-36]